MHKRYRPLRPLELEILMLAHYHAGSEIIALICEKRNRGDLKPSEQQCRYALNRLVQEGMIDDLKGEHYSGDRRMIAYTITDMGKKALRKRMKSLCVELGL